MKIKEEKGITGIDITISIVLIAIFIGLTTTLTYQINKTSVKINRRTEAMTYAVETVETIKSYGFEIMPQVGNNKIDTSTDEVLAEKVADGYIKVDGEETPFYREVSVLDYTELKEENSTKQKEVLKKVTVTISYKVGKEEENVQLSILVTKES